MRFTRRATVAVLSVLLIVAPHAFALDVVTISYPGPAIFFLPAEIARQQGFFRDQNLDAKLILTRSDADRAALASGDVDYTLRGGSTVLSAARIPALLSGAMDAGLIDYSEAFRARKSGYKILLNAADHYSVLSAALGANLKKLREQPQQVRGFLKANVQAHRFMRENREATLAVLMNWIKADRETAEGIYQLSIDNFTRDGTVEEAVLKAVVDQQLTESKVKEVPLSQVADFSLLHQVLKDGR